MESWRKAWRDGFSKVVSLPSLLALKTALETDDDRLTQGSTVSPPPLDYISEWPCEGGCAVAFCGWIGDGLGSVGEVDKFFAEACHGADSLLGEPAACRWFLNFFDDTPRDEMRRELLAEVEIAIREKGGA